MYFFSIFYLDSTIRRAYTGRGRIEGLVILHYWSMLENMHYICLFSCTFICKILSINAEYRLNPLEKKIA